MKALTHREACYELRRAARLLGESKITLGEWCDSVHRILRARVPSAQGPAPELSGARS